MYSVVGVDCGTLLLYSVVSGYTGKEKMYQRLC